MVMHVVLNLTLFRI